MTSVSLNKVLSSFVFRSCRFALLALTFIAFAKAGAAQTTISGNVYDGNGGPLVTGTVYHASGAIAVPAGQTLTVQEGVIVKYSSSNSELYVGGTLLVNGTSGNSVIFTSQPDDTAGGDTNGDGPSVGAPGDWRGIRLATSATGVVIDYLDLRFHGEDARAGIEDEGAGFLLRDSVIRDGDHEGISLAGAATTVVVAGCTIHDNAQQAVNNANVTSLPGFTNNTAYGNGGNYIRVTHGTLVQDTTLVADNCLEGALVLVSNLVVPSGRTLTLEEGVVFKAIGINIEVDVSGTLVANGTVADPVVITAYADDDHAGDTNGDGPSNGAPGDWRGVRLLTGSSAHHLEHAVIRYAGEDAYDAVDVNGAETTLLSTTISGCLNRGLDMNGVDAAITVTDCVFEDNQYEAIYRVPLECVPGFTNNSALGAGLNYMTLSTPTITTDTTISAENCLEGALVLVSNGAIPTGATLTLRPDVVFKVRGGNVNLSVVGTVRALGTPDHPVVFTSISDDDYAGDTNGDGASTGAPGDWQGLIFQAGSDASLLEHTVVRYAGEDSYPGIDLLDTDLTLRGVHVADCNLVGLDISSVDARPTVEWCFFENNGTYPVYNVPLEAVPGFAYNRARGNGYGSLLDVRDSTVTTDITLAPRNGFDDTLSLRYGFSVVQTARVKVLGGTVLKFNRGINGEIQVQGGLDLLGTAHAPVVFTAIEDDEYGGDAQGDGASSGTTACYHGIRYLGGSTGTLRHVLIRYPGEDAYDGLYCASTGVSLDSIRIEHANMDAFELNAAADPATNLVAYDFVSDGIYLSGGAFDLRHATVSGGPTGIRKVSGYTGTLQNCVAWNCTTDNYSGFGTGELFHCNGSPAHAGSNGCIDADPLFVDAANGDLCLQLTSPCVDAADYATALAVVTDADENSRILDPNLTGAMAPDMGAYEHTLWTMSVRGVPALGHLMRFQVDGPAGTSIYLLGLQDGVTVDAPFGLIAAGTTSLMTLGTGNVGSPHVLEIPRLPSLIGVEFAIQTRTFPLGSTTTGAITNVYRDHIRPSILIPLNSRR